MWKKALLSVLLIVCAFSLRAQVLTYSFTDPCTKETTFFSVPIQGSTVVFFLNQSRTVTAAHIANGEFAAWVNQVYADYRKVSPCGVQSTTVIRNQITSQVIGNVIGNVVSSINSSVNQSISMSSGSSGGGGGDDAASKGKTETKKEKRERQRSSGASSNNQGNGTNGTNAGGAANSNGNNAGGNAGGSSNSGGASGGTSSGGTGSGSSSGGSTQGGGSSSQPPVGTGNGGTGSGSGNDTKTGDQKTEGAEMTSTQMNIEVRNDKSGDGGSSGGGGGKSKSGGSARSNPLIVSSDLTSAQNLDKSFTGIINFGMSQSSMSGTASWGVTSMVWFNLKQFALSGRYTVMKMNKKGTLKYIHNMNLTAAYSYGNVFGFVGYSGILNAGKWGIAGFNMSGAATKTPDDKNIFISPSVTAFYTRPFKAGSRLMVSPEIYIISTPIIYSSVDKITVSDRTFSGFLGAGFDYQLTKRFKFNANYKANLSTNPDFPILSFFLIGSKINL